MGNNGNLFNESISEVKEKIIFYLKCFERTEFEAYKIQYLLHVEYWERVLRKMKQQNPYLFYLLKFFCKK